MFFQKIFSKSMILNQLCISRADLDQHYPNEETCLKAEQIGHHLDDQNLHIGNQITVNCKCFLKQFQKYLF